MSGGRIRRGRGRKRKSTAEMQMALLASSGLTAPAVVRDELGPRLHDKHGPSPSLCSAKA